jgi:hypothetical protein
LGKRFLTIKLPVGSSPLPVCPYFVLFHLRCGSLEAPFNMNRIRQAAIANEVIKVFSGATAQ